MPWLSARTLLLVTVATLYAFILIPLVVVIAVSFNAGSGFDFPPVGFSLRWYEALFGKAAFLHAFINVSLLVGAVSAFIATVFGTLAAIGVVRFHFPGRGFLEAFFLTPLIVPHILLGAALYLYFTRIGLGASLATLIAGHVLITTPFVIRSLIAGLVGLDPNIEEAAVNLGASKVRAFFLVALPQIKSSVLSGAVFAFIVSFSDINVALFIAGPDTTTLPVYLFSQLQWDSDPSVAAASAIQIVLIALIIVALQKVFRVRIGM
jgi:putative spermidine/putrescine transport system permease protein